MFTIPKKYWYSLLFAMALIACISTYFTIFLPYVHEEARYTLASIGMFYNHYYWQPADYGIYYRRPPLFNWLMLPLMHWLGVKNVLVCARLITASFSVLLTVMLGLFALRLFKDKVFAIFAVVIFFCGADFLFRRSWIAYPDTLFAFFTFTAVVFMWLSLKERRPLYWLPIPLALFAAFLSKALTCYVFYATALLVVWLSSKYKSDLFKPISILAHLCAIALPLLWFTYMPHSNWHGMLGDVSKAIGESFSWLHYLKKIFLSPIDIFLRVAPTSLLVAYCLYRQKKYPRPFPLPGVEVNLIKQLVWILLLSILPYWFSSNNLAPRYFLPVFPMAAIVFAYCIWHAGEKMVTLTILILLFELVVKCTFSLITGLPWHTHRDPQQQIANDIIQRSQHQNLYAKDFDAYFELILGPTIAANGWPTAPLTAPPVPFTQGCVVTNKKDVSYWGRLQQTYKTPKKTVYLYCLDNSATLQPKP